MDSRCTTTTTTTSFMDNRKLSTKPLLLPWLESSSRNISQGNTTKFNTTACYRNMSPVVQITLILRAASQRAHPSHKTIYTPVGKVHVSHTAPANHHTNIYVLPSPQRSPRLSLCRNVHSYSYLHAEPLLGGEVNARKMYCRLRNPTLMPCRRWGQDFPMFAQGWGSDALLLCWLGAAWCGYLRRQCSFTPHFIGTSCVRR
jgi:hypothetical protein